MRKFYIEEMDEDIGTLYVGTDREIRSLYKSLETKTPAIPLFVNYPEFKKNRMYGIHIRPDGFYTVENADMCLRLIV